MEVLKAHNCKMKFEMVAVRFFAKIQLNFPFSSEILELELKVVQLLARR